MLQNLGNHHLTRLYRRFTRFGLARAFASTAVCRRLRRDDDTRMQATIFRHDITHAVFIKHPTHDLGIGTLGDLDNAALRTPSAILAGDAHQHPVAMQGLLHLAVIQKDVGTLVTANRGFRTCKAKSIRVALDTTGHKIGFGRQNQGALAVAHQLAFAFHGTDATFKRIQFIGTDGQLVSQFVFAHRAAGLLQGFDDIFARGQRVLVFPAFPLVVRVLSSYFGDPLGIL